MSPRAIPLRFADSKSWAYGFTLSGIWYSHAKKQHPSVALSLSRGNNGILDFPCYIIHLFIPLLPVIISPSLHLPLILTQIFPAFEGILGSVTVQVQISGRSTSLSSASPLVPPVRIGYGHIATWLHSLSPKIFLDRVKAWCSSWGP